jgi:hypothetical protein
MRKTELVHLHALCACLRAELGERRECRSEAFDGYERLAIGPTEIQHSKAAHREAVVELLDGLTESIEPGEQRVDDGTDHTTRRDVQ